jgi:hypothetical protein
VQELEHGLHVVVQIKGGNHGPAAKKFAESRLPAHAQNVEGFRKDGFAGAPGWSVARRLPHRPLVVGVAATKQSD